MILRDGGLVDVAYSFFGAQQSISFLGTPQAVLLGLIYVYLPFMVMPLYAALEKFDWSVVLAARDLGGGTFHIIRSIVLPIIEPAVTTGALFVFVLSFGDFVVSDILGGARNSMVGNAIRDAFLLSRNWPQGAAMTLLVAILLFGSFHFRRIFIR